jgi:hypothetical protein
VAVDTKGREHRELKEAYTDKKENRIFPKYKEIQKGAV